MYKSGAPRFVVAMSVNSSCALFGILLAFAMRLALIRANKKLAEVEIAAVGVEGQEQNASNQQPDGKAFQYVT